MMSAHVPISRIQAWGGTLAVTGARPRQQRGGEQVIVGRPGYEPARMVPEDVCPFCGASEVDVSRVQEWSWEYSLVEIDVIVWECVGCGASLTLDVEDL